MKHPLSITNGNGGRCLLVGFGPTEQETAAFLRSRGWVTESASGGGDYNSGDLQGLGLVVFSDNLKEPDRKNLESAASVAEVPVCSTLEIAFQSSRCLVVAVAGSAGKSSTARLIESLLGGFQKKTMWAGGGGRQWTEAVEHSKDLDYLVLEASEPGLAGTCYFRPAIAVVTCLAEDVDEAGLERIANLFSRQQPFDWLVIQTEALARLRLAGIEPGCKVVTFSSGSRRADIHQDRGLLLSQWPGWEGPLMDLHKARFPGAAAPENLMAALAVGRILRIPLEHMVAELGGLPPMPGACERVFDQHGVVFVDDSRARLMTSLKLAIESQASGVGGAPNILLIAGGHAASRGIYEIGPLLSRRVRRCILLGAAANTLRAAWGLFTPCTVVSTLLEAVSLAADDANSGDIVLFSPACSGLAPSQDHQEPGDMFRKVVLQLKHHDQQNPPTSEPGIVFDRAAGGSAVGDADVDRAGRSASDFACGSLLRETPRASTSLPIIIPPQVPKSYAYFVA